MCLNVHHMSQITQSARADCKLGYILCNNQFGEYSLLFLKLETDFKQFTFTWNEQCYTLRVIFSSYINSPSLGHNIIQRELATCHKKKKNHIDNITLIGPNKQELTGALEALERHCTYICKGRCRDQIHLQNLQLFSGYYCTRTVASKLRQSLYLALLTTKNKA